MDKNKIAVFAGGGLIANIAVNRIVLSILKAGFIPILFRTKEPYSKRADTPEINEISFYENKLLNDEVFPFLESGEINLDHKLVTNLSYKQMADIYEIEYQEVSNVNDPEFISKLSGYTDLAGVFSVRNYQVFHEEFLNTFSQKNIFVWNLHSGLLPDYKGVFIPYRAIENDEKIYGWTLHKIDRDIDTGDIIASEWLPLDKKASVLSTYLGMIPKGVAMFERALDQYKINGNVDAAPQPQSMASNYFSFPSSKEMSGFKNRGISFTGSPMSYVDILVHAYSVDGTGHANELRKRVINAIAERAREFLPDVAAIQGGRISA